MNEAVIGRQNSLLFWRESDTQPVGLQKQVKVTFSMTAQILGPRDRDRKISATRDTAIGPM